MFVYLLYSAMFLQYNGFTYKPANKKSIGNDFMVVNIINDKTYGIEVKAGKAIGKTVQMLLDDGKVEAVYFLKGDTYGGITDQKITIPIYLVGRLRFDYEREM